jgi:hypothetical protein
MTLARIEKVLRVGGVLRRQRSKSRLRRRQASEEPPRQPRVIAQNDPLSLGNHGRYIDL